MHKQHKLALLLLLAFSIELQAEVQRSTQGPVVVDTEYTRFRLSATADYVVFSKPGDTIGGLGLGADLQYAFTQKWGMGAGVKQAFSSSDFAAFFTEIHVCLSRALTGTLMRSRQKISLGAAPVSDFITPQPGGITARLYVSQYLVNTFGSVLPYTGVGVGGSYDWNLNVRTPMSVGFRIDRITNGTDNYLPFTAYTSIGLWL